MKLYAVDFEPLGRRTSCREGASLLEAARRAGIPLASVCGGRGTCGQCRVRASGPLSPPTAQELERLSAGELAAGYRLACQAKVLGPTTVLVPPVAEVQYKVALPLPIARRGLQPNVRKLHLRLPPPSLEDQRPDLTRLRDALGGDLAGADLVALRQLPRALRGADWRITAVLVGGRLISVEEGDTRGESYGLAFDLGTTTVAAYLLDLDSGRQLGAAAATNRQTAYGEDVMTRLDHAHAGGLAELREAALETLNSLVEEVCRGADVPPRSIYEAVLVGNTCMHHLLLGLDPHPIGVAPYIPALGEALDLPARELGLAINPGANVHLLPPVAGFVGADAVADALAAGLGEDGRARLMLDLGTNAEMMLSAGGRVLACAAAAGPAFEGARISCGMRAAPGAIDRVEIAGGHVRVRTIGGRPPLGLAGSGLVSAAAALRREGLLSRRGHFVAEAAPEGLFSPGERGPQLVLAPAEESGTGRAIVLSQGDIAELLLAKAAIEAGVNILLREAGLAVEDLEEVLIAGSFGNYVDKLDAMDIGLVPPLPPERVVGMGNAAGAGAVLALLSVDLRRRAQELARRIEYIELSARPDFNEEFVKAMTFPQIATEDTE